MKNLLLILALFVIIPNSMQGNFSTSKQSATIEITGDNMTIETILPDWKVKHHIILKKGLNRGYYVLRDGQSFSYEIINY